MRHRGDHPPPDVDAIADPQHADRGVDIRDRTATLAAHLVTEQTEPAEPPQPDGSFDHGVPARRAEIRARRHLDHERALRHAHLQRGVVQVTPGTPVQER
jgi:hypothetical protein